MDQDLIRLTILVDDFDGSLPGFVRDYGLSILVEFTGGGKFLFDTGSNGDVLESNFRVHGVQPSELDAVVLSHDHFDHTGGLQWLLGQVPDLPVFVHARWSDLHSFKGNLVPDRNRVVVPRGGERPDIHPGVVLTGAIPARGYGGIHEQACYVVTRGHSVLLTGCSHPGLVAFLAAGTRLGIPSDRPLVIAGGFHGSRFTEGEVQHLAPRLETLYCAHCSSHCGEFKIQFPGKCRALPVGETITLE
ncbi:MAG: MBL fold metallo-hydrolase [Promethearchaeota archaeon]